MQLRSPSDTQDFQWRSRASPTIVPSPYPVARPKHRQRLNPRPRPPCCMESCCIFRGFEYASGYRGRRFDTGQHCFRSPIISAPRFQRFVPQGTLSFSLSFVYLFLCFWGLFVDADANAWSFRERALFVPSSGTARGTNQDGECSRRCGIRRRRKRMSF